MMRLQQVLATARSLVVEVDDGSAWAGSVARDWSLDGQRVVHSTRNVLTLHGLEPDRDYALRVLAADGEVATLNLRTRTCAGRLDVRECGARGDGDHDDSAALQAAIASCPPGGTVYFPEGDWLSTALFLRSHIHLQFAAGARLLGHPERARWPLLPGRLRDPAADAQRIVGSWEGQPRAMHGGLLTGIGVEDVQIHGAGVLDGNAAAAGWWVRAKAPHRGWRPRLLYLSACQDISVAGLRCLDAGSWQLHALRSERLLFAGLDIHAPVDSPNTDGLNPESCRDVQIAGVRISTGDDCIAVKSGKRVAGLDPRPSQGVVIRQCLLKHGHGAVVIGSETAGGVYDVRATMCRFEDTERGLRIKTRRGRGRMAVVDGVQLTQIQMARVGTPFVVNSFYWCDPDGKAPEVGDRQPRPVDAGTPEVRNLVLQDIDCQDTAHCAIFLLGLPEQPIAGVRVERFRVRYAAHPTPGYPDMAAGIALTARAGVQAWNVRDLTLAELDLDGATMPQLQLENVT